MAMLCPRCDMPIAKEETLAGVCPVCAAPLPGITPPVVETPPPPPPPRRSRFPLWAFFGFLAACLVVAGIMFHEWSANNNDDEEPDRSTVADSNKKKEEPPSPALPSGDESKPEAKKPDEPKGTPTLPPPNPVVQPKQLEPVVLKGQRVKTVPWLENDAIKIDGDLSDWKDIEPLILAPIERGNPTNKAVVVPKSQKAYLAYCPRGLLIAVDVIDTSGKLENEPRPKKGDWAFWSNDAVEVFIETVNMRVHDRGEPSAHQFIALPFGTATDQGVGGYESRIFNNKGRKQQGTIVPLSGKGEKAILRAAKKTATGWTMEMLIPKSALRKGELRPGKVLGFELQIDTGTNIYYYWACDNPLVQVSMHPDVWGEVILGSARAKGR